MWDESALAGLRGRNELIGLARDRNRSVEQLTIRLADLESYVDAGWEVRAERKRTAVVAREKAHSRDLEDRVWMVLYRMGFPYLSGADGAKLAVNPAAEHGLTNQVDVVALDDEVCVAIECKSMAQRGKRPNLQQEVAKHALIRERLTRTVNANAGGAKRTVVLALWARNATLSRQDRARAAEEKIILLDDDDLAYYETLTQHLGPAARYQFLADLIPGKAIPGLSIKVPALMSRMGGYRCYTFSVRPDYLLKIAYVSHRAKGKRSDIATYQRMVSRSRLRKIAKYISEPNSLFPTNIVINLEASERGNRGSGAEFHPSKQDEDADEAAVFGWLTLRPAYKSAWIIDGQHRLYAYSGHPRATNSVLSVLAFEGLPGDMQQKLFSDINHEQKSVKRSLLHELWADLHANSDDPRKRTQALISAALQNLNEDEESPLFDRILLADSIRTDLRCISLAGLFSALDKPGLYYGSVRGNVVENPGPFWGKTDPSIVERSTKILNAWFGTIENAVPDWWAPGAGEGGGLAMNDGVTVCINVLRSVVEHLDSGKNRLHTHSPAEVIERLKPFAVALGEHLASMSGDQRLAFRSALRGVQGQTAGVRHAQAHLHERIADYNPEGLHDYLEREKAKTNDQAMILVNAIERLLGKAVVSVIQEHFGLEGDRWWWDGVPNSVRVPVLGLQNEDKDSRGSREAYFNLIHYRPIVLDNWLLFDPLLGRGKSRSKDKRTEWMVTVNEIRKLAAHPSSAATVSFEQIAELQELLEWLQVKVSGASDQAEASLATD